ncbi:MAG: DUF2851 family protein, partial [Opitutaceae bacterium]|nr:DUF2851 family protein [Opitutaceae bacterium]
MKGGSPNYAVAEVQGLYGPFTFYERLLQQIWDRGDFDRERLVTMDGRAVVIEHRGKWNGLGGPDFRQARIRIGGVVRTGDVELHLHAEDWAAHRHAQDPAYRNVVLHVVLFPPSATHRTIGHDGAAIPVGSLLTLLRHDLEEYASDEAVAHLSNRGGDRLREELRRLDTTEIARRLREGAMRRWQRKAHYAKVRVERLGYAAACHQTALEVLGYRFNRVPMLNLAARHPLTAWHGISADMIEAMLLDERANWARCGVRPANHPRRRLRQYAAWTAAQPDWPDVLTQLGSAWRQPGLAESTRVARQS